MKSTKSAIRYAKALLDLSIELNKVEVISSDMRAILDANNETPDFQLFLNSPLINSDKKISILKEIFDGFDELSISFVSLIAKKRRENILSEIAAAFESLWKEKQGIVPVTLVSSIELDNTSKDSILAKVKGIVNGTIELTEEVDESILGGFILKMDDKQIDASVRSQLNNLKQRLTR